MFFAGGTVTIALVSLAVAGIPLITTMGLMAAVAVVVAVLAASRCCLRRWRSPARASTRCACATRRTDEQVRQGLWSKWANEIARHPRVAGLAALAILIPADDPAAVAEPRPAGHRGAVDVDDRAQSV